MHRCFLMTTTVFLLLAGALQPGVAWAQAGNAESDEVSPAGDRASQSGATVDRAGAISAEAIADTVSSLRLSGDYTRAAHFASMLVERLESDPDASELDVEDAAQLRDAMQTAAALPEEARAELSRAESLGVSMTQHWMEGRYAEGAVEAEERLAIYRRYYGGRHLMSATAADELASLLQYQGEYERAEPLFLEALDVRRQKLGERHVYVGASLNNLGMLYQATGDLELARENITSALSILEDSLGHEDLNVAAITANLGMLLQYMGDLDGAESHLLSALAIRRSMLGEQSLEVAESLNSLGVLYFAESDFAAAEPFLREATAIWRGVLGDEHPHVALSLTNMGALLSALGEYAEAQELHREAVRVYRATLGEGHPDVARALHNLAHALEGAGDYAAAEPILREALGIRREAFGDVHPEVAESLTALAHVLQTAGLYEEAEPLYREALGMHRDLLGEHHLEVATDLSNLASLLEEDGRLEEAIGLYGEALTIREDALGSRSAPVAHSLSSVGHLRLRMGDAEGAEEVLSRAAETYDAARLRAGAGMSRATMALRLRPPSVALAAARLRLGREAEAWPAAEKALARALADLLLTANERSLSGAEAALEDSLRGVIGELEAELAAYTAASDTARLTAEVARDARERLLTAEAEWSAFRRDMSVKYAVTEGHAYSLDRVQRSIGSGTAVVGWIDADVEGSGVETWGYVIRAEGDVFWAPCVPGRDASDLRSLRRRYARFRQQLANPSSSTAGLGRDARELWRGRVEPLLPALEGVQELVVLPSGPVLGVPLEAFADADGALLGERFSVSYAPSATIFAWLEEQGRETARAERMLLLGDPPFTASDLDEMEAEGHGERAAERASVLGLPRLPGSRYEVEALAALSREAEVLLGPDAAEQRLVEMAESGHLTDFGIVHMATHALVDDERPERSALVLSQVGLPAPLESALAGERIYDGLLTAAEIVREWELTADLVTLSACETALGREVVGEGYIGFAHAFLQAGARSLLVSLWKVDDTATSLFMSRFYENRLGVYDDERAGRTGERMSKSGALREAKEWLRAYESADGTAPYAHPYYWSAFILIGDKS